nr:MAG TPA: hypothetical protein [Caudoviricetes sp.]
MNHKLFQISISSYGETSIVTIRRHISISPPAQTLHTIFIFFT